MHSIIMILYSYNSTLISACQQKESFFLFSFMQIVQTCSLYLICKKALLFSILFARPSAAELPAGFSGIPLYSHPGLS